MFFFPPAPFFNRAVGVKRYRRGRRLGPAEGAKSRMSGSGGPASGLLRMDPQVALRSAGHRLLEGDTE